MYVCMYIYELFMYVSQILGSQNLPQILIRLMQLSLPAKSIAIADRDSWNRTLTYPSWGATPTSYGLQTPYSDDIISLTLILLQKILTSPLLLEIPKLGTQQRNKVRLSVTICNHIILVLILNIIVKDIDSEGRSTMLSSLHGIVDLLTAYIDCAVLEKDKIGHIGSQVLTIVLNSEIFTAYQRIILSHREQNCAVIYYDDGTIHHQISCHLNQNRIFWSYNYFNFRSNVMKNKL